MHYGMDESEVMSNTINKYFSSLAPIFVIFSFKNSIIKLVIIINY